MRNIIRKNFGRSLAVAALGSVLLFGTGGCPDELVETAVGAFNTGYDIGSGYDDSGWDGGWDGGSQDNYWDGHGESDGYYHNDYTETSMNGDSDGFYIAGDGFSYISGW